MPLPGQTQGVCSLGFEPTVLEKMDIKQSSEAQEYCGKVINTYFVATKLTQPEVEVMLLVNES